ncbi:acylphosphatase [Luteithermobacter gelatinilyticus]|uniref:acylphosphatase n=1 Tax=Luteithermobacter gelatinilyticus TaxID=2582913 RepID=UPI001106ED50|nr:acylphosphatase [Luteithermobacter gelatinilyticus]
MLDEGYKAVRMVIHGRVQGVWYRAWTVEHATALGLDGWVRNRADGTVEALLVGREDKVEEMIRRCHLGPERAVVEKIEQFPARGITPKGFVQKPTVDVDQRRS